MLDTAEELLTSNVPRFPPAETAGDARRALVGAVYESAVDVAVLDGERLVGLVPVERLLAAASETPLAELMDPDPPRVGPGIDRELAAWETVRGGETSLAVVGAGGRFLGLVPPRTIVRVLLEEHEEDVARLAGYLTGSQEARSAAEEPVGRRLWHRLPWLLVGLAGAMGAAAIVSGFEEQLREEVLLAFFVPGVVYMADAVGTQTEAVVIRGIAVGVPLRDVVRKELATGALVGALIATAFLGFAYAVWGNEAVALAVALSLFATCSTAGLVAMALPYVLHRVGRDPAFGAGPVATVLQDLVSITVFFVLARAIVS